MRRADILRIFKQRLAEVLRVFPLQRPSRARMETNLAAQRSLPVAKVQQRERVARWA